MEDTPQCPPDQPMPTSDEYPIADNGLPTQVTLELIAQFLSTSPAWIA